MRGTILARGDPMIHVVGSINLDLIATLDRLPAPGETLTGTGFSTAPGGKGANQALAARRAGANVALTGMVGDDAFSAQALALLLRDGVDLSGVGRSDKPTGTALILVGGDGENMIAVIPGANASVTERQAAGLPLEPGDVVLLQNEIPPATVAAALRHARAAGATTIYNLAPARPDLIDLVAEADIIVANETEFDLHADALGLGGRARADRMITFAAATGRTVIVTLGADGVIAASATGLHRAPSLPVHAVDTVGAGDTFCGYLAAGIAEAMPLDATLRLAAAAGSIACLKPGAQPAIPVRVEVDAALSA